MSERKPAVVVGSINIDLVARTGRIPAAGETVSGSKFEVHHGGKGANQAVAIARLGYPVRMIGRVGDDAFGQQLRAGLTSAGVDIAAIATSEGASGVAVIVVSEAAENMIVVTPGANGLVTPQDLDDNIEIIRSAGIVLAQFEIPMETVVHLAGICNRECIPLVLDPAPAVELPAGLLRQVTWLTPNETEAAFYTKHRLDASDASDPVVIAERLLGEGAKGVVLKLGARGAFVTAGTGEGEFVTPFTVDAVDTTAAGDCFNGAFAVALMRGYSLGESARFAAAAAAISVTRAGAQPSLPSLAEVERLLGKFDPDPLV